jgi:hypothetical protein
MPFDKYGFLGAQAEEISRNKRREEKELFDFVDSLNKFAQLLKYDFNIHNEDPQELIIGALFIKAHQSFESVVILAERGLVADSKSILRVLLEAVFYLKAVCEDRNFTFDYIKGDDVERFKILNRVFKDNSNVFSDELKAYASKERIEELRPQIWKRDESPLEIYKVAKRAGMDDFYQLVYGTLSADIHTSVGSLEKYYGLDQNGKVVYLESVPNFTDMKSVIVTSCSILIVALGCTSKFFELDYESEISRYREEVPKFDKK